MHQAAESLGLYHETTVTSVMVIGSGKNKQWTTEVEGVEQSRWGGPDAKRTGL